LFGPKILFCNHIPIVLDVVGDETPERAELSNLLDEVVALGPQGWSVLGFDGDQCFYNRRIDWAILQVSVSERTDFGDWVRSEFLRGVATHPLAYAEVVARELGSYFRRPIVGESKGDTGWMSDPAWVRLKAYSSLLGMPREAFSAHSVNWVARDFAPLTYFGKWLLAWIAACFQGIVLLGTLLAAACLITNRSPAVRRAETVVLCVGGFVASYVLVIALSHTFDIVRYASALVPLSLLWFLVSAVYLPYRLCIEFRGFQNRWFLSNSPQDKIVR